MRVACAQVGGDRNADDPLLDKAVTHHAYGQLLRARGDRRNAVTQSMLARPQCSSFALDAPPLAAVPSVLRPTAPLIRGHHRFTTEWPPVEHPAAGPGPRRRGLDWLIGPARPLPAAGRASLGDDQPAGAGGAATSAGARAGPGRQIKRTRFCNTRARPPLLWLGRRGC